MLLCVLFPPCLAEDTVDFLYGKERCPTNQSDNIYCVNCWCVFYFIQQLTNELFKQIGPLYDFIQMLVMKLLPCVKDIIRQA